MPWLSARALIAPRSHVSGTRRRIALVASALRLARSSSNCAGVASDLTCDSKTSAVIFL